jgi:hypothetical protein
VWSKEKWGREESYFELMKGINSRALGKGTADLVRFDRGIRDFERTEMMSQGRGSRGLSVTATVMAV